MAEAIKSHETRLNNFIDRCRENETVPSKNKFELRVPTVVFVEHVLSADGVRPDPTKMKAIVDMPSPTDASSIRRFLGVINYLAKFLPDLTSIVRPIQNLVSQDVLVWNWRSEHDDAMRRVKAIVSIQPVPAHFDESKQLIVESNASKDGLSAALLQSGCPHSVHQPSADTE